MTEETPKTPKAAGEAPAAAVSTERAAAAEKTAPAEGGAEKGAPEKADKAAKKKIKKNVAKAIVHVQSTFNNTIITIADANGDTLCWSAAGTIGYSGSKKSTPFAAQRASEQAAGVALKFGVKEVEVKVNGPGSGRESAVRALQASGLRVLSIEDVTPLPHNGCRPRKRRRV
ncbi:MAG: 30S ribosomal protein S11 [Planctomycetes bacterium]|nr:30S ribosomal protein S11 [Planctomycetota bacterium]